MKDYWTKLNYSFLILWLVGLTSCIDSKTIEYTQFTGETWGTYYKITIGGISDVSLHDGIVQILKDFDIGVSTYVDSSFISKFNKSKNGITLTHDEDKYFGPVFLKSKELLLSTDGYLDVSVMPLLNYWGFGYKSEQQISHVDSQTIEKLKFLNQLNNISRVVEKGQVYYEKSNPEIEIDFSALAKGYGIDMIGKFLDERQIANYLIDIGGEARSKGVNKNGDVWTLAINKPDMNSNYSTQEIVVQLPNKSIATSGNYREMITIAKRQYGHIIDPKTGYPGISDVLSATIVAPDCMVADGIATACVAAGRARSRLILDKHPNVAACLIYDENGDKNFEKEYINGFEKFILQ